MATYTTKAGDMVDEVCFKHYGHDAGMTEKVLEANVGLADFGAVLPAGITIILPDHLTRADAALVRLWS